MFKRGIYSGKERQILGASHIVVEMGVYSGIEGYTLGTVDTSHNHKNWE